MTSDMITWQFVAIYTVATAGALVAVRFGVSPTIAFGAVGVLFAGHMIPSPLTPKDKKKDG